jgi:hypothetical protein
MKRLVNKCIYYMPLYKQLTNDTISVLDDVMRFILLSK